jgi:hypothetical protein
MDERERVRWRFAWFAVSAALGVAAFWVMAQAYTFQGAWLENWRSRFDYPTILPWIGWLSLFALAGCLASLALRTPRSLRYRPWRPLVGSLVPVLLIAHGMAWLSGWTMPGFLRFGYFYAGPGVQSVLAIAIGLAVASGFEGVGFGPARNGDIPTPRPDVPVREAHPITSLDRRP